MNCAACEAPNEADARFCEDCGAALDRCCDLCGAPAKATAKFCCQCGGSLDGPATPPEQGPTRKTVTVLFADLAGSTTFEERVDAETAREVLGDYHTLLRRTADQYRAGVVKYIGDGFMAVWGVPEVGVDDAGHAVDAAVELQERFVDLAARVSERHGQQLALRVAVNTGEVVVGAGDADLVGDALNVAARLESECPHGEVVAGEETWRATRGRYRFEPLSRVQVKGRTVPVSVYQWIGRRSEPADAISFVGRAHEIRRLRAVLDDAVLTRTARLVTVVGDPGVGKTRLAAEFAAQVSAPTFHIRCAAEGTVALAPVVDVLRTRDLDADIPVGVAERDRVLRGLTGMADGVAGSVEETFWSLRRFFEVLAADGPLVIVLDDIQWADTLLLDFVDHVAEWARDAPILMVALARPELRETNPELLTVGGWVGDAIRLAGLEPAATAELASRVVGAGQLPAELLSRLPASTGGNPLFVRELIAMLVHDGVLVAGPSGWRLTIDADAIAVPPTIQALLASRLERMNIADRRVLEIAAVIGTDFSPVAVCALGGRSAPEIKASLDRLRRLELIQPSGAYIGDERVWRFHHVLIRDVAYRRLLKSDRAELHERLAGWIQTGGQGGVFESDEIVARHLESAHRYRVDLGNRDAPTAELAVRSARCYLSAARRALDRDALVSAGAQAARGAQLATVDAALRAELLMVGCEAFLSAGDVAAGADLVDELEGLADDALVPWAVCYRCQFIVYTDPSSLPEIDQRIQVAIDEFARRGDPAGLAKAYRVRANARARLGRIGDCESDLFEALIAARQAGDHRQITASLGAAPSAALWGPSPAPKAGGRCLDVVRMQRMTTAAPSLEATSLRCLAVLELLRGRPDKARSMLADAGAIVSELGLRHGVMETELYAGIIELLVGDPVAAEPHFRTALEGLDSLGVGADAGQAAALLARSVLAQGQIDEADHFAAQSERIAGHNLKTAIAWRAVRAEILSAQGRHDAAVALAREAVDVAAETDLVLDYADACLALSRVSASAGDQAEAARAQAKAESLYAAKDAVFLVGATSAAAAAVSEAPTMGSAPSRLTTVTRASDVPLRASHGVIPTSADYVYEDHRRVTGEPLAGGADLHAAAKRKVEQFPHVEAPVLAARGGGLALIWLHWWDEAGNETASLDVFEVNEAGELDYHGRFDEDDFESAYFAMEERYYAGEGAAFATNGRTIAAFLGAMDRLDLELARTLAAPQFCWFAEPSALTAGRRTLEQLFAWLHERAHQVASSQNWAAAITWLSPECYVALGNTRSGGVDGDHYEWTRLYVGAFRSGALMSIHQFDVNDEDAAFAYAESLAAAPRRRLVLSNRASQAAEEAIAHCGDAQSRVIAVRGERHCLMEIRVCDEAGSETRCLQVFDIDDDGSLRYESRFDADEFVGAYAELEQRYRDGDGADIGPSARAAAGWVEGIGRRDIAMVRRFSTPDFRWYAAASSMKSPERTVEDVFAWLDERGQQVTAQRHCAPVLQWVSRDCAVALTAISATGLDGEEFLWESAIVGQYCDGRLASVREFDTEDEAFAYAEAIVTAPPLLATINRASVAGHRLIGHVRNGEFEAASDCYADHPVYEDRRHISGNRVNGRANLTAAFARVAQQYSRFDLLTLAVRGQGLHLAQCRWSDPEGYQTSFFNLQEVDDRGLIVYDGRFDEDDFDNAYAEMERRYHAGEGAAFAEAGAVVTSIILEANRGNMDKVFGELLAPDLRVESRSRTIVPSRTVGDWRASVEEFNAMVSSSRVWNAAVHWLSPNCVLLRQERAATGHDGECYEWSRIYVGEGRGGRVTALCEFDVENEAEAFAYAEDRVRAQAGRLAVCNAGTALLDGVLAAMRAGDLESAMRPWADDMCYEDHRRISGGPITERTQLRSLVARILQQYNHIDSRVVAVRGAGLWLTRSDYSDDSGNRSSYFGLFELSAEKKIAYGAIFDEDDFDSAYAELERRYYAGAGAAFSEAGARQASFMAALNRGDLDAAFGLINNSDLRFETRSKAVFGDRTPAELRSDLDQLFAMTAGVRWWHSAVCWLSPDCCVARQEREASGPGGESYAWTDLYAITFDGAAASWVCRFNLDDEEQAFAAAEERRAHSCSRLATSNRASVVRLAVTRAIERGDIDAAADPYTEDFVYEDRRRLSGDLPSGRAGIHAAFVRLRRDYSRFGGRGLAVRGERLALGEYVCSDDSGNQMNGLMLTEIEDDGGICFEGRFDADDFATAYAALERRYYSGEGARFAEFGTVMTGYFTAMIRSDLDTIFNSFTSPDFRIESRSGSVFVDRSVAEHRASLEELRHLVGSVREWMSAVCPLSSSWGVGRYQREATGPDGEAFAWERIVVAQVRDGRLASVCDFDPADEDAAFAYAEEIVARHGRRLSSTNLATDVGEAIAAAFRAGDLQKVIDCYAQGYVFDDRRRMSGDPVEGRSALHVAAERIAQQYNVFDFRCLAVRGERLSLGWTRWSDAAGNETSYLHVGEIDSEGRVVYAGRFDEDDFEGAYAEMERRYYAGEGAEFATCGLACAAYVAALNRGDLEAIFGTLTRPGLKVENRSRNGFPDRSAEDLRGSIAELSSMVDSVRTWFPAVAWVSAHTGVMRMEREAVGHDREWYAWSRILVCTWDGRLAGIIEFDPDDEDAAFAYAESVR